MRTLSRAFTLIELLLVVAIISLLLSILLPAVGKAREAARRSVCASQYLQIGNAIRLFATDNMGFTPPHTLGMLRNDYLLLGMTLNMEHSDKSIYLGHLVDQKYISSRDLNGGQLMYCPSRDPWDRYGYWGGGHRTYYYGLGWQNWGPRGPGGETYNWNQFVEISYGYIGCIKLARPGEQTVLGVECFWKDTYVRDSWSYHSDKVSYGAVRAHGDGFYNVLMIDGSVRSYSDHNRALEALPPRAGRDGVLIVQSSF